MKLGVDIAKTKTQMENQNKQGNQKKGEWCLKKDWIIYYAK
jgi:hypothetical protein